MMLTRVIGIRSVVSIEVKWATFYICVGLLLVQAVLAAVNVENYVMLSSVCALIVILIQTYQAKHAIYQILQIISARRNGRAS